MCATPIAGALLIAPASAQEPRADAAQQGPILEPVSAAENLHPASVAASRLNDDAASRGRRIVSTAFVQLGPDARMRLEMRDGGVLMLQGVTMEPHTVCGVTNARGGAAKRRCINYSQVTQARPADPPARVDTIDAGPGQRATERTPAAR